MIQKPLRLIPEDTCVPFLSLDIYWHFITFVKISVFTKFIKPKKYLCSCKWLSVFEASVKRTIDGQQKSCRTKEALTNLIVDVGSGVYIFDISTLRTINWSCLPLPPCVPRSAHASPSPVTYQNGACFKKYNYHLFFLRVSDKTTSLRSVVYTFICTAVTEVVNLNDMFPLSLQVLCFRCTFTIF